ncbi:MAG: 50S ribosomal protein L4 [Candidatus Diapherotrites archaeon]|nr:50S ribosomal protein L4 [Candidatus Diapherotrites archaeon]
MKVNVYGLDGKTTKQIELPVHFSEIVRPDIINRAVISSQTARLQPKGNFKKAGRQNTAEFVGRRRGYSKSGSGNAKGLARLPRMKNRKFGFLGSVAAVPFAVGGPRAHPPKPEKNLHERINKKERLLAIRSAIAATAQKAMVIARGHKFKEELTLPIIIESKFETLNKTSEVEKIFLALGVIDDVVRAKSRKTIRAGKGTRRNRKFKRARGPLVITSGIAGVTKAARNIEGVEVINVNNLNAEVLAPGRDAGRLTIWTESAIKQLEEKKLFGVQ